MMYEKLAEIALKLVPWKRIFRRRKRCLLIIEDREEDAEFLKALVAVTKHDCEIVNIAEAGLSLVTRNPDTYPIVFVDIRLPLMDGLTFVSKVLAAAPKVHVVIISGMLEDLTTLDPGLYVGLIGKPVTARAIRGVITKTRL